MKKTSWILATVAAGVFSLTSCSPFALVNSEVYNNADLSEYHTFRIVTPDDGHLPPGMEMVTYYNIAAAIREQMVERGFTESPTSPILINIGLTVKNEIATAPLVPPMATLPPVAPPVVVTPPPAPAPAPRPEPGASVTVPKVPVNVGGGPGLVAPPAGSGMHFVPQHPHPAPVPVPAPAPAYYPFFMYPRSYYWPAYYNNAQVITGIYKEGVLTMDIVNMAEKLPLYSASVATILGNGEGQFRNLKGIAEAVDVLFSKFPVPIPKTPK